MYETGLKVPLILAMVCGIILCGTGALAQTHAHPVTLQGNELIFSVEANGNVMNNPPNPTVFSLDRPRTITKIQTYHQQGQAPGSIGLRDQNGNVIGWWSASGNTYWVAYPYADLAPGYYTVLDSDQSSWSYSPDSGRGATWVYARG